MSTPTIVNACTRDGRGGNPTAVLADGDYTDAERSALPAAHGASHAVFIADHDGEHQLRFFTATGELPACGHATAAAIAVIAQGADTGDLVTTLRLRTSRRAFTATAHPEGTQTRVFFDPGPVAFRDADDPGPILTALGLDADHPGVRIAGVARERLLVPLPDPAALAELKPDRDALKDACAAAGLLGAYVHAPQATPGRHCARMFAPSIGVPEDIANANGTACLAAGLGGRIIVDMGDALGVRARIEASAGPDGTVRLSATAAIAR